MDSHKNKGFHENAMEKAKDLLNKGIGMEEIKEVTGLNEHDITKARKKMEGKM
ncbi:hypothetical protein [Clostridium kluyveri]|uniref:hypothetical protein n=1 Tax=Clostridium kluyveri TaxID=1534 RepID=UPI000ACD237C|nr:hypothetical protein [Clostridium kluyveri]UZQ49726.1 hypothetical protein OP486_17525 [Clostridium kluyveri]